METNKSQNGAHAQQAAIVASAEMKRAQALERLDKLTSELHEFVKSKVNIHKEIKTKTTGVVNALQRFRTLDDGWQAQQRQTPNVTPKKSRQPAADTVEEMDTGAEGDGESVTEDRSDTGVRSGKRKDRNSPDPTVNQVTKKKDTKPSPPKEVAARSAKNKEVDAWQKVESKKRRQEQDHLSKQLPKEPRPEPKRKKSRKWIRPDALIIRPAEKEKYSEILRRIKRDVPADQVRNTVEKIRRTMTGDMLITLSRKSADKGQALQRTITGILQDDAKVVCKGPQETIEIRDIDEDTTKEEIQAALKEEVGKDHDIPLEGIKIRKAFRGTQTAAVTLPMTIARKLVEGTGKIHVGWVNCRIKETTRPIQCFKCWHFGHVGPQCKSQVDRSKLCIRCGQEGHRIADCKNSAKCAICAEQQGAKDVAHHAGTYRCPVFQEALQKLTNKQA